MPTLITKTLKKDGSGDYTTLDAFIAAEVKNLVTADETLQLDIYGSGWDNSTPYVQSGWLDFNGFTTDATRKIILNVVTADRHNFTHTTGFIINFSGSYAIVGRSNVIDISGAHIAGNDQGMHSAENISFSYCLIEKIAITSTTLFDYVICYDVPTGSGQLRGVSNNCTVILKDGEGNLGGVGYNTSLSTNCLGYQETTTNTREIFINRVSGSDYNGAHGTGEGIDSETNSLTTLTTADFEDYANKDFRLKSTSTFATAGAGGTFMGAAVASGGSGVTLTSTLGTIEYNSNDVVISLTGSIDVAATLGTISYSSNDTSVSLFGVVDVNATLGTINYESNDTLITVFGDVGVIATLGTINYNSNDVSISLSSTIEIDSTLGTIDYSSNDAVITLQGQVSVITTLGTISYDTYNVNVQVGTGQIIGTVTAGFANDIYSSSFKPSAITVNFKS
jgi:hypothetical protein